MARQARHQLIYSDLVQRLQRGDWRVGDKFPTVNELLAHYEYSHRTIFKGIQQLAHEGYLRVTRGRNGTFVARTGPAQNVGLLMNESYLDPLKTPYPYVVRAKVLAALAKNGYSALRFFETDGTEFAGRATIEHLAAALKKRALRGLIAANSNFPQYMHSCPALRQSGVPCVVIGRGGPGCYSVDFDVHALVHTAFEYMADRGRRKVAVMHGVDIESPLQAALTACPGLLTRPEWLMPVTALPDPERQGFHAFMQLWARKTQRPDALLVTDDMITKGAVQAVLTLGLRVPEDLLLIHMTCSGVNVFYPLSLPKIEYDLDDMVHRAVRMLGVAMADAARGLQPAPVTEVVQPRLVDVSADGEAAEAQASVLREEVA